MPKDKNTLTDKEIEVFKTAVHWFMEAVEYCDEFNVQKIKGYSDDYWKMDDALYAAEMLLDKLTGGHQKKMQEFLKEFDKRWEKRKELYNAK